MRAQAVSAFTGLWACERLKHPRRPGHQERSLCSQPRAWTQGTQTSLPRAILSSPCPVGICASFFWNSSKHPKQPNVLSTASHISQGLPSRSWDFQGLPRGEFTTSLTHHSRCTSEDVLVPTPPPHTSILKARGSVSVVTPRSNASVQPPRKGSTARGHKAWLWSGIQLCHLFAW